MLSSRAMRLLSSTRSLARPFQNPSNPVFRASSRGLADGAQFSEEEQLAQIRAGIAPATGRPLAEVAAEVWGHTRNPAGPGHRSGQKVLRRPLKGPLYLSWYPPSPFSYSENPIRLTEKQERWQKKLKILRAAGKGPPKKGAGKRSK